MVGEGLQLVVGTCASFERDQKSGELLSWLEVACIALTQQLRKLEASKDLIMQANSSAISRSIAAHRKNDPDISRTPDGCRRGLEQKLGSLRLYLREH